MKRGVVLAVVLLAAVGCGKLTKDEARAQLQTKAYDADDNVYCTWSGTAVTTEGASGGKKLYTFSFPDKNAVKCIDELDAAGIVKKGECTDKHYNDCWKIAFELGPVPASGPVRVTLAGLQFACGKKSISEVSSVSTEDKNATVQYTQTITPNADLAKKFPSCAFDGPKAGTTGLACKFRKDDDGKWALLGDASHL